MLALSAPLLTGKSNTDPDKLMQLGADNKIQTAMGNFQKFIIGHGNSNANKLTINGKTNIKGNLTVGDSVIKSDEIRIGSELNPIFYVDKNGNGGNSTYNLEDEISKFKNSEYNKECENPNSKFEDCTNCFECTTNANKPYVTPSIVFDIKGNPIAIRYECGYEYTIISDQTKYTLKEHEGLSAGGLCRPEAE